MAYSGGQGDQRQTCEDSLTSASAAEGSSSTATDNGATAEDEQRLALQLQKELEDLRVQTKSALQSSWAEVERLQQDGSVSRERVEELEGQLKLLRDASEARQRGDSTTLDYVFDGSGESGDRPRAESGVESERHGQSTSSDSRHDGPVGHGRSGSHSGLLSLAASRDRDLGCGDLNLSSGRTGASAVTAAEMSISDGVARRSSLGAPPSNAKFQSKLHENLTNALSITQDRDGSPLTAHARRRMSCSGRVEPSADSFASLPASGVPGSCDNLLPADMLEQLASLEQDKRIMVEELETKLKGKEAAIATLERTTSLQSSTVETLKKELAQLQHEAIEEDNRMREEMEKLEQDHAANQEKAMALEREIAKLELMLEERKTKETQLAEELAALEEQTKLEEQKAQEQITELEEKLQKKREACSQIEQENDQLRQSCNEEFEALRQDLMEFLPQSKSEELIEQLMEQFASLKEKEEVLAEELAARMQDRQEILAALEKVSQVGKRVDAVVTAVEDLIDQLDNSGQGDNGGDGKGKESLVPAEYKLNDREVAIACLNKALLVPNQIKESLDLVEGELMNLLDSMEVNGKNRPPRQDSSNDALEKAEALQEEAKIALKEVEAELMDLLASLEEHTCDVVDELEAELASKDAKLASLESTTAKQEHTIESLTAELSRLQSSSKEESQASLVVMDNLQREVNTIVEGIAEKDQMISTLTKVLEEREGNKAALQKELTEIRGKLTTLDPACPRDQCHAVL